MSDSDSDIYIEDDEDYEHQPQAFVRNAYKLRNLYPAGQTTHDFSEYQINRPPESLAELVEVFRDPKSGSLSERKYVWINEQALVRCSTTQSSNATEDPSTDFLADERLPPTFRRVVFEIQFDTTRLHVLASFYTSAAELLRFLCRDGCDDEGATAELFITCYHALNLCPLPSDDLARLMMNYPKTCWNRFCFNPDQSRALFASSPSVKLHNCQFSDGGDAVVELLRLRDSSRTLDIEMDKRRPFDDDNLLALCSLLSQQKLVRNLSMRSYDTEPWEASVLISQTQVDNLILEGMDYADVKVPLIEAIRVGQGALGIRLNGFDLTHWPALADALASPQCVLEQLTIDDMDFGLEMDDDDDSRGQILASLQTGLRRNQSLQCLDLTFSGVGDGDLEAIYDCLAHHPSLVRLSLSDTSRHNHHNDPLLSKVPRALALGNLLERNRRICWVNKEDNLYDKFVWKKAVQPMLERNGVLTLMKNFLKIESDQDRAYFLSPLMEKQSATIVYILLKMNSDVLSIYLNMDRPLEREDSSEDDGAPYIVGSKDDLIMASSEDEDDVSTMNDSKEQDSIGDDDCPEDQDWYAENDGDSFFGHDGYEGDEDSAVERNSVQGEDEFSLADQTMQKHGGSEYNRNESDDDHLDIYPKEDEFDSGNVTVDEEPLAGEGGEQ